MLALGWRLLKLVVNLSRRPGGGWTACYGTIESMNECLDPDVPATRRKERESLAARKQESRR